MKFKRLAAVDETRVNEAGRRALAEMAETARFYPGAPEDETELLKRMAGADGVLVSWKTPIPGSVIAKCPELRYIGMCAATFTARTAPMWISAPAGSGGSPSPASLTTATTEWWSSSSPSWCVCCMDLANINGGGAHRAVRPQGGHRGPWHRGPHAGPALRFFKAEVYYYSRTRKPDAEAEGIAYLPLAELLKTCDCVSTHLPKNTFLLGEREFDAFGDGKILINTAIGPSFDAAALERWLRRGNNYYICDRVAAMNWELPDAPGVLMANKGSGGSAEEVQRLSKKVVENALAFLAGPSAGQSRL